MLVFNCRENEPRSDSLSYTIRLRLTSIIIWTQLVFLVNYPFNKTDNHVIIWRVKTSENFMSITWLLADPIPNSNIIILLLLLIYGSANNDVILIKISNVFALQIITRSSPHSVDLILLNQYCCILMMHKEYSCGRPISLVPW